MCYNENANLIKHCLVERFIHKTKYLLHLQTSRVCTTVHELGRKPQYIK